MEILSFVYLGLGSVVALTTLVWLLSLYYKDASLVDRVWGLFFVAQTWAYSLSIDELNLRQIILLVLVSVWGMRLSLHIHLRNHGHEEDYRYQNMRKHRPHTFWWRSFFTIFLLQALLSLMIGAPLLAVFAFDGPDYVTVLDIVGALLWTLGFYFEAVGDWQLKVFKSNPKNKGKLMTSGLWGLTRHPNYFGDATLWWGFGVMALSMSGGYWTVFGPLMMSLLIVKVSGVALLEKNLKTAKPGYEEYMASTPAFFPNFFKFLGPKSQL